MCLTFRRYRCFITENYSSYFHRHGASSVAWWRRAADVVKKEPFMIQPESAAVQPLQGPEEQPHIPQPYALLLRRGGGEEASLYPGHLKAECLFIVVGDAWEKVFSCSPVGLLEAQWLLSQNVCSIQTLEWWFNWTRLAVTTTMWCCFYLHKNTQTSKCLN